ncbi:hypothetical protein [uncultured Tateyamaria sp.]|uniref:hypothetical protein n=2 Tax=uncultured Tateyamaria sp. TaxID=455651 RepID=UPI00260FF966|nr:hypothetical protein [uncultured Tateyamaria sp.]
MQTPNINSTTPSQAQQATPDSTPDKKFKARLATNEQASSSKPSVGGKQLREVYAEALKVLKNNNLLGARVSSNGGMMHNVKSGSRSSGIVPRLVYAFSNTTGTSLVSPERGQNPSERVEGQGICLGSCIAVAKKILTDGAGIKNSRVSNLQAAVVQVSGLLEMIRTGRKFDDDTFNDISGNVDKLNQLGLQKSIRNQSMTVQSITKGYVDQETTMEHINKNKGVFLINVRYSDEDDQHAILAINLPDENSIFLFDPNLGMHEIQNEMQFEYALDAFGVKPGTDEYQINKLGNQT